MQLQGRADLGPLVKGVVVYIKLFTRGLCRQTISAGAVLCTAAGLSERSVVQYDRRS